MQISTEPGNQYNVSLINALVLFVGTQAIAYIHSKGSTPSASTIAYTAHMDIFQHLLVDLDTEGKCESYMLLLLGGCYSVVRVCVCMCVCRCRCRCRCRYRCRCRCRCVCRCVCVGVCV